MIFQSANRQEAFMDRWDSARVRYHCGPRKFMPPSPFRLVLRQRRMHAPIRRFLHAVEAQGTQPVPIVPRAR